MTAGVFVHDTLGGNVIAGVMDEVDSPNEFTGQKKRVLQACEDTVQRFEHQIEKDGCSMGKIFLVSSRQEETAFLDAFIERMKYSEKAQVYDMAQWDVLPKSAYSGVRFPVAIGNTYTIPKIIDQEEKDGYIEKGKRVIDVPIEHKLDFELNIEEALISLAGVRSWPVSVCGSR